MTSLLSLVKTTHNREVLINYLDECATTNQISTIATNDEFTQILQVIGVNNVADITDQLLQSIKSQLLQAPTVKLYVNSILSTAFITKLHTLLFKDGEGLIDINISSTSNGGFILYKDGKVFNYSFEHLVSSLFADESFKQKLAQYI